MSEQVKLEILYRRLKKLKWKHLLEIDYYGEVEKAKNTIQELEDKILLS